MRDEAAVRRFVESFALALTDAGMPRMAARVFAALLTSDEGRMTAAEIGETLAISPAAVSGAVRYLIQVDMIERERIPGERRDHYRLYADSWYEMMMRREPLLQRWERQAAEGVAALGPDTAAGRRMADTRAFFAFVQRELPLLLERWRARGASSSRDR